MKVLSCVNLLAGTVFALTNDEIISGAGKIFEILQNDEDWNSQLSRISEIVYQAYEGTLPKNADPEINSEVV